MTESEARPSFYALSPGGWRDYWTLLHPPYTLWHLSYVAIGASLAPRIQVGWLLETLVAFLLAMGVAAHALDELHGRPLHTRIPDGVLRVGAAVGLAGAIALGIHGTLEVSAWLWAYIAAGGFLVLAYNLELFGGAFHTDAWFAVSWGAFPVLTASFAQTAELRPEAIVAAAGCAALALAQRALSTPVRRVRRDVVGVEGSLELRDGSTEPISTTTLRATPERALRWLSVAMPALAVGLLIARLD
jgi:hypothetical protein